MDSLCTLVALIREIPGTFWGVVIGAVFSLGGVYLTNRAMFKRMQKQHDYEREVAIQDREMDLKKEIYLKAYKAARRIRNGVMDFVNTGLPASEINKMHTDDLDDLSQACIIADRDTFRLIQEFLCYQQEGKINVAMLRKEIEPHIIKKENLKQQFNFWLEVQKDRVLNTQHHNESTPDGTTSIANGLNETIFIVNECNKLTEELAKNQLEIDKKQFLLAKESLDVGRKLSELLHPILVAFREELRLPIDVNDYYNTVNQSLMKRDSLINECMEKLSPF